MGYDFSWLADGVGDDEHSGTATFIVEGRRESVRLGSFTDARRICEMIDAAFNSGRHWTRLWVESRQHAMKRELQQTLPSSGEGGGDGRG